MADKIVRAPKTQVPQALERLSGQPRVQEFLSAAVNAGRLNHAYLFVGPPGAGKTEAARMLAKCVIAGQDEPGHIDEWMRVDHGTHPDVHVYAPESATGYLVAQVRALIEDVPLAPVRAKSKVYILRDVGLLRGTAANALLKTIEEPPAGVMFILIARSVAQVMPTIASRCQQVPFRVIATDAATQAVVSVTGAEPEQARIALAVAGTPERARQFLASPERRQVRRLMVRVIGELPRDDDWDVLDAARTVVEAVRAPLAGIKAAQETAAEEKAAYLSRAALKQIADANKRELPARARSGMMDALAAASSLLRDVLLRSEGVAQPIVNGDMEGVVDRLAQAANPTGVLAALDAIGAAPDNLTHNVTPQLTFVGMLLHVKEALCPTSSR